MALLTSKWMIAVLAIVALLVILYLIGRKSAHSEIAIPASAQEVWAVLMDTEKIKDWNPVLIPIEGELKEGGSVKYKFYQDENNVSEIPAKVKHIKEASLLNQAGGMAGILTFDHRYILEEIEGGTKVTIHEDYRGIYVPFWNPAPVEEAYKRLAEALKARVIELKNQE